MKYLVGALKVVWTIVKIFTLIVGGIALFLQFVMIDTIGIEKSKKLKGDMYYDAANAGTDRILGLKKDH